MIVLVQTLFFLRRTVQYITVCVNCGTQVYQGEWAPMIVPTGHHSSFFTLCSSKRKVSYS